MRRWRSDLTLDARNWQLLALAILLFLSNVWSEFGSGIDSLAAAVVGALAAQAVGARIRGRRFDWRSPLITAFSLALLLRAPSPIWHMAAGAFGIGAKWIFRWRGKHIFNPANIAVVALLLVNDRAWITPGQWGDVGWAIGVMIALAALVLSRAGRVDIALGFFAAFATAIFSRGAWLGDPWTIPFHQLQSGALIIFTCFMITDPRSTPDHRLGRMLLAVLVALVAVVLQIRLQIVGAPLFALALLSPLTPLIDLMFKKDRFEWRPRRGSVDEIPV